MNHEVPQPITSTRSPGRGSLPRSAGRASRARRQVVGWERSSVSVAVGVWVSAVMALLGRIVGRRRTTHRACMAMGVQPVNDQNQGGGRGGAESGAARRWRGGGRGVLVDGQRALTQAR